MAMPIVNYPISDYEDLKEAVQLWADRDDSEFLNQIPNFIDFAQKEIYRNLRTQMTQKEAYLEIINGQANIPLDWLSTDYLLTCDGPVVGRVTSIEEITDSYQADSSGVLPFMKDMNEVKWCRVGTRFLFSPKITANLPTTDVNGDLVFDGSEVVLGYYSDPSRLTIGDSTNYLLTVAPDLMLFKTLKFACDFIQDYQGSSTWSQKGDAIINQLNEQHEQMDYSGSPLVIPMVTSNSSGTYHYI